MIYPKVIIGTCKVIVNCSMLNQLIIFCLSLSGPVIKIIDNKIRLSLEIFRVLERRKSGMMSAIFY